MAITLIGGAGNFHSWAKLKALQMQTGLSPVTYEASELSSLSDCPELAGNASLFGNRANVIIRSPLSQGSKNLVEQLASYAEEEANGTTELFLYEPGTLDKRLKIYKLLQKENRVFDYPEESDADRKGKLAELLSGYGLKSDYSVKQKLLEILHQQNLFIVEHEVWKLNWLVKARGGETIEMTDLEAVSVDVAEEIWELLRLAAVDKRAGFALLEQLWQQDVAPQQVIGFLAQQLRQLLQYKREPQSLPRFMQQRLTQISGRISDVRLGKLILKLADIDCRLKSTNGDPRFALLAFLAII